MIELDLEKIRGTTKTKVPVKRAGGTNMEYRRTGRKLGQDEKTSYTQQRVGHYTDEGAKIPKEAQIITGHKSHSHKIGKLSTDIQNEILNLRSIGYSGTEIKNNIETMIELSHEKVKEKLINDKVIDDHFKLLVTPQALTDYAKQRGVVSSRRGGPKTKESIQAQEKVRHDETKKELAHTNEKNIRLEVDMKELKGRFEADRKQIRDSDKLRDDMRTELRACKAKLAKE